MKWNYQNRPQPHSIFTVSLNFDQCQMDCCHFEKVMVYKRAMICERGRGSVHLQKNVSTHLTQYHTIPHFDELKIDLYSCRKHCQ